MSKARDLADFQSVNVESAELAYLNNARSNIQAQIDTKSANTYVVSQLATKAANTYVVTQTNKYLLVSNASSQYGALATDNSWTGSQRATNVSANTGSFDMDSGQNFTCNPTGNFTLTFTNITDGQTGFIKLVNTSGHTVSLHTNSKADANFTTTTSTAGSYVLSYYSDGTNVYLTNSAAIA